jgi:hypothetical protein
MGEEKVTEWIRDGQIAWMENIAKGNESAYGKSPPNLSKNGGGHLSDSVQLQDTHLVLSSLFVTYGHAIQGSYASLQTTEKGRSTVSSN